jgi:hypothetical protein
VGKLVKPVLPCKRGNQRIERYVFRRGGRTSTASGHERDARHLEDAIGRKELVSDVNFFSPKRVVSGGWV